MLRLTTKDKTLLKDMAIDWEGDPSRSEYERVQSRNRALVDEQTELLTIQANLIKQRDHWHRCWQWVSLALGILIAADMIRLVMLRCGL